MAKARVTLRGCKTYTLGNKTWIQGRSEIITRPSEIDRLKLIQEFVVTDLEDKEHEPMVVMKDIAKKVESESGDVVNIEDREQVKKRLLKSKVNKKGPKK